MRLSSVQLLEDCREIDGHIKAVLGRGDVFCAINMGMEVCIDGCW